VVVELALGALAAPTWARTFGSPPLTEVSMKVEQLACDGLPPTVMAKAVQS
jgi:hypothetical protein